MATSVRIHGNLIDPTFLLEPELNPALTNYVLVYARKRLSAEETNILSDAQCIPEDILIDNVYLCRYEPVDLGPIRKLDFVQHVNAYHPALKIQGQLQIYTPYTITRILIQCSVEAPRPARRTIPVTISLHDTSEDTASTVADQLCAQGIINPSETTICSRCIDTTVSSDELHLIAVHDCVRSIEELSENVFMDERSRIVSNVYPYYPPGSDSNLVNNTEYLGAGQVINIVDTGFDNGDLTDVPPGYDSSRLLALYNPFFLDGGIMATKDRFKDTQGHGTLVCGCALLDGWTTSVGGVEFDGKPGKVRGTAPEAKFVITKVYHDLPRRPFAELLDLPYDKHEARISNHSYGSQSVQRPYEATSREIDEYVYTGHYDHVVVFAAGNLGRQIEGNVSEITGSAAAKNIITVGNSCNGRKIGTTGDRLGFDATATQEADINQMNPSSSRGPTFEGRIKPDICGPGTAILTSRSRSAIALSGQRPRTDPNLEFVSGTSSSAPGVAGCAAVVRQALMANGKRRPSAAVVKALLINGAIGIDSTDLSRKPTPNGEVGFGFVNLGGSLRSIPQSERGGWHDERAPLRPGQRARLWVTIPPPIPVGPDIQAGWTLKVTLVWTDIPGAATINQFGLAVTIPNVVRRHGNKGNRDMPLNSMDFDLINNVQQVWWKNIPEGKAEILVECRNTFWGGPAVYALAWSLE